MQIFSFFINLTGVWMLSLCVWVSSVDLSFAAKPTPPKKTEIKTLSLTLKSPQRLCRLAYSSQMGPEALEILNAAFQEVIGVSCELADSSSLDAERARTEDFGSANSPRFLFWVEVSSRTRELVIRAYELSHGLQWGFVKARIEGLSPASTVSVEADALRKLMSQFPFAGVVEGSSVILWKPVQNRHLELVKRSALQRHPLNAFLLRPQWTSISTSSSQVARGSADAFQIDFSVPATEATTKEELWIVLTAS